MNFAASLAMLPVADSSHGTWRRPDVTSWRIAWSNQSRPVRPRLFGGRRMLLERY